MHSKTSTFVTFLFYLFPFLVSCQEKSQAVEDKPYTPEQEKIIEEFITNGAKQYGYNSYEYQEWLDKGLKKDSTIAYLWQQKAMPLFKQRKYEIGMQYIDKAVYYKEKRYLPYRAFIKCIFSKQYREAIIDFQKCIDKYGNSYEMDHTYAFYIGISHLQLNEFQKAEEILSKDIQNQINRFGEAHHLDLFYLGISKYEQKKWQEAITEFDKSIAQYPDFAEPKYYKAISLLRLEKSDEAKLLFDEAIQNGKNRYTINEDNAVYETYPYQIRWKKFD